ncbi:DUF6893 family small protein [Yinghuangia seranimata]
MLKKLVVLSVAAAAAVTLIRNLPDLKRYLKIRQM